MVRRLRILTSAAAALLLAASCATVEFDNPLDPKGNNYLWGYDVTPELEKDMLASGDSGSSKLWTEPEYHCDRRLPGVRILGDNPAVLKYNTPEGEDDYKKMMGLFNNYWLDAIDVDRGERNTKVTIAITLSTTTDVRDEYDNVGQILPSGEYYGEMPPRGRYYIIYIVKKEITCAPDGFVPETKAVRTLIIE